MLEFIVSTTFCFLTGLCGVNRRTDFLGTFVIALLTSPLVVQPVPFLTGPSRRVEWRQRT